MQCKLQSWFFYSAANSESRSRENNSRSERNCCGLVKVARLDWNEVKIELQPLRPCGSFSLTTEQRACSLSHSSATGPQAPGSWHGSTLVSPRI
jgi:hypothetical protein